MMSVLQYRQSCFVLKLVAVTILSSGSSSIEHQTTRAHDQKRVFNLLTSFSPA